MLYCQKCGKVYNEHIKFCPDCKCNLAVIQNSCLNSNLSYSSYKKVPFGSLIIAAIFPWFGILMYIMYRDSQPDNAKRVVNAMLIYIYLMLLIAIVSIKAIW